MAKAKDELEQAQSASFTIGQQVRAAKENLLKIEAELADFEHDEGLNAPGAAVRAAELRAERAEADAAHQAFLATREITDGHLRELAEQRAVDERDRRLQTIARTAPLLRQKAIACQEAAAAFKTNLSEMHQLEQQLAAAIGTTEAARVLSFSALRERVRLSFYTLFFAEIETNPALAGAGVGSQTHWFGWSVTIRNAWKDDLLERTDQLLDHLQTVFLDENDARYRAKRLDPTGQTVHILPVIGQALVQIVRGRLRSAATKLITEGGK